METIKQYLSQYDKGEEIEAVEMGGMGDGYEAAIQFLAIETMRELQDLPIIDNDFGLVIKLATETASNRTQQTGYSGAQFGAAQNIAAVFWRHSPAKGIQKMRDNHPERIIKIKKVNGNCQIVKK